MLLSNSNRKLLAERLKTGAEDVFGNQPERNAMVQAMRSGKPPMETPAGEKLKNLAMGLVFAGPGSKTADLLKLNVAKRMEEAGAKTDDILRSTGWFKGMEGKWKYEIPDDTSRFSTGPMTGGKTVNAPAVLDHEALYAAYPHLRQTKVGPMPADVPGNTVGMFQGPAFPSGGQMFLNQGARKDTALHELQHAIQEQEGFGLGGSPEGMVDVLNLKAMQLRGQARKLFDTGDRQAAISLESEARRIEEQATLAHWSPDSAYKQLAGEIEARNVQKRMTMNPERRQELPPWMTQDIPPDQAIVSQK